MVIDPIEVGATVIGPDLSASPTANAGDTYDLVLPKVLVVEDDLLFAETLVFALTQRGFQARFAVPATLLHIQDAISWRPDLAIVDIDRVQCDPTNFVGVFREAGVAVVLLAGSGRSQAPTEYAGAAAVIVSNTPLDELVRQIRTLVSVSAGRNDAFEEPVPAPARYRMEARPSPLSILTPREQSVLAELMEGKTADAIARSRWVALSTVRSQIKSILQKLGVNSQLAAVALARQAGWGYEGTPATKSSTPTWIDDEGPTAS